jgi:predicted CoA-binding protein
MASMERVRDFLSQKRLAFVGVSRQPKDYSRALFREFGARGYDAVPVNPAIGEIEGQRCFARVQDIEPVPDGVVLLTSPAVTEQVVGDCIQAGVKRIWMCRTVGKGAVSARAVGVCEAHGVSVIPGECPFMFLKGDYQQGGGWVHRLHGFVKKLTGSYPN